MTRVRIWLARLISLVLCTGGLWLAVWLLIGVALGLTATGFLAACAFLCVLAVRWNDEPDEETIMELMWRVLCRPIRYPGETILVVALTVAAVSGIILAAG